MENLIGEHARVAPRHNGANKTEQYQHTLNKSGETAHETGQESELSGSIPVAVVIPAYNEERFIGSLVIETLLLADRVIVVDDGSTDNTSKVARLAGADVIIHNTNQGKGVALENGLAYACEIGAQAIVVMDGDGQHRPNEISELVKPILQGEADMVIGSRFREIKSSIPGWRQFGQHALTYVTNVASQMPSTDSQSGFRAFSRQAIEALDFSSAGFSVESEMQFLAAEHKWRVVEAPITCIYEEKAKRNPVKQGLQVLNGIFRLVSMSRPLFFFGLGGLTLVLFGILGWALIIEAYSLSNRFTFGYASLATLIIVVGVLAMFQGITLHTLRNISNSINKQPCDQEDPGFRIETPETSPENITDPNEAEHVNPAL